MLPMGMKVPVNPWPMTARGDRLDWSDVKDRLDLAAVSTSLLGPAPAAAEGKAASGGSVRSTTTRTRRSTSTRSRRPGSAMGAPSTETPPRW
jgi:hypothetical protein